jgi:hypothetical protein
MHIGESLPGRVNLSSICAGQQRNKRKAERQLSGDFHFASTVRDRLHEIVQDSCGLPA